MGFVSNQWLNRGDGSRSRGYHPKEVEVSCFVPRDSWSTHRAIRVEFKAKKSDGEYQTLHLTQAEVDAVGEEILKSMSIAERERLLVRTLRNMSHAKLLRLLAFDLRARIRLPK